MNASHLTFYPQYQLNGEKMILKNMDNKSGAGLSKEDIFQLCSNMLINSSIAIACGPFLDRDIMHSMDICISGIFYVYNFLMYQGPSINDVTHFLIFLTSPSPCNPFY